MLKVAAVCTQLANFVKNAKEMMKMIKFFTLLLKPLTDILDPLWLDVIREEQKEYNKDKILYPNDGSDWKRELL